MVLVCVILVITGVIHGVEKGMFPWVAHLHIRLAFAAKMVDHVPYS